jgi:hypothetical protein
VHARSPSSVITAGSSLESTHGETAKQALGPKADALALLDEAMLFLRGGIDALQDR